MFESFGNPSLYIPLLLPHKEMNKRLGFRLLPIALFPPQYASRTYEPQGAQQYKPQQAYHPVEAQAKNDVPELACGACEVWQQVR